MTTLPSPHCGCRNANVTVHMPHPRGTKWTTGKPIRGHGTGTLRVPSAREPSDGPTRDPDHTSSQKA